MRQVSDQQMQDTRYETETFENNDDSYFAYHVTAITYAIDSSKKTELERSKMDMVPVRVNGQTLDFGIDSGAEVDIMSVESYYSMHPRPPLQHSNVKLKVFGATTATPCIGCFETELKVNNGRPAIRTAIQVTDLKGKNLLSKTSCKRLGLITINLPSVELNQVTPSNKIDKLVAEYDDIFRGIGCHKDTVVSLEIDPEVKPVACPPTRVPVHLLPAIRAELDRLQKEGVVEDVPVDDNTQWVSRMVPVPRKVQGQKEPGMRITLDLRNVNKGLKQVHHQVPGQEELRYDLNGAKIFSDLDMNDAFSQLPLDPPSRKLTTFSTPWGLKRLTRMVQGAKPSAAIFHETLRRDLEGMRNVKNIADNIIVWGVGDTIEKARRDHFECLKAVFELFKRKGLTLNRKKCNFGVDSMKFFGYIFSADGISPDPEKVRALQEASPPANKDDVRSFLGFTGFNQQFIPEYATISEPLHRLTAKEAQFHWGPEQVHAFESMKQTLVQTAMLSYFDPKRKTALFTDGSPLGVNASLSQVDDNGVYRPVAFASRALNTTEQKYSQIEREAVAAQFGCHRFRLFLFGKSFKHFIDPASLKPMLENPKKDAPACIERLRLKIQGYENEFKLIDGKCNPADYMSRHPMPYQSCTAEEKANAVDIENHVFYIAQCLPDAITTNKI